MVRLGGAWLGRLGRARLGVAWLGKAGMARQGGAWPGQAGVARPGRAGQGGVGQAWQEYSGMTLACPVCGREMPVTPHRAGDRWTAQQVWLVQRLRALGATPKMCLRALQANCNPRVIEQLERRRRLSRKAAA